MTLKNFSYVIAPVFILVVIVIGYFCLFNLTTTVLLVRHAERADNSANTNLSQVGLDRAQALVGVADEAGVAAMYSTDFCRTAQTAQPLASAVGLSINVQQSGNPAAGLEDCDPSIDVAISIIPAMVNGAQGLVDHVLSQHGNQVVLIVGHSGTVPAMVQALGQGVFSAIQIGENDFDNLFVITVPRYFGSPKLAKAQYGN